MQEKPENEPIENLIRVVMEKQEIRDREESITKYNGNMVIIILQTCLQNYLETNEEYETLRFQSGTSKIRDGRR